MSGYSAPTAADATPTEIATDGSVQRLSIADQNGFDPALILAKAGIPIELTFAPGQECRATVVFPEINVTQDISQGGVVSIAGLTPGTYTIQCGGGSPEGTLIVE
jgi:plastocyanin domain-containing protein